ncbi:hypothetical protein L207DRAFT_517462 [Hyaloscypha variabilis F]|uniref:Flavin reductase like domain-containing protein n=1 Tax=Hyaloscypha variabilis (strain UAMH 11265 / GT02V1 / F) TaxID=1149755 RepID=A0A2J6R6Y6_HYAVF|nr:hypothetical protein L207DRAFT_517462 [Hyaloscypha variabilis F]
MICKNGGRLASNCLGNRSGTVAARGFYEAFWRWSTVGCQAPKRVERASIHTTNGRASILPARSSGPLPQLNDTPEPPSSNDTDSAKLSTTLRLLMRTLPHSVVVVTAAKARIDGSTDMPLERADYADRYRAMTVSSFTTITLSPDPIISFNVKFPSETLAAIEETGHFLVHILEANEAGARIADSFAHSFPRASKFMEKLLMNKVDGLWMAPVLGIDEEYDEDGYGPNVVDAAMIIGEGVERYLSCSVVKDVGEGRSGFVKIGDHVVVIAKVEDMIGSQVKREGGPQGGLCYADGKYRKVGGVIEVKEDISGQKLERKD